MQILILKVLYPAPLTSSLVYLCAFLYNVPILFRQILHTAHLELQAYFAAFLVDFLLFLLLILEGPLILSFVSTDNSLIKAMFIKVFCAGISFRSAKLIALLLPPHRGYVISYCLDGEKLNDHLCDYFTFFPELVVKLRFQNVRSFIIFLLSMRCN